MIVTIGLVGCGPPGPRALLDGERLIKQGRYAEAVGRLQRATELLPKTAQAWNHLGLAHHGNQQPEEAARAYQTALHLDSKLAAARFNLGCLMLEQNNLPAAVQELTAYTLIQPTHVDGWLQLGTAHLRSKRLELAATNFTRALSLHPRHPVALNNLGVIQFQRRQSQDALNYFKVALNQDRAFAPALLNVAVVNQQGLNNRRAALEAYRQYLAAHPQAANWQSVDEAARQLNAELNPSQLALQPVPATPPPQATARTSLVASVPARPAPNPPVAPAPRTNPPPIANVRPPTPTNPPAIAARPPPEPPRPATNIVSVAATPVADDLVIRPAQDLATRTTTTAPAPAPTVTAPAVTPDAAVAQRGENTRAEPAKLGFLTGLNPFSRKPKEENAPKTANVIHATNAAVAMNAAPVAPPPPPPVPRYPFQSPAAPRSGNRTQAEPAYARGVKAHQGGNRRKAIEEYQTALRADPGWFDAYFNLALAAQDTGELGLSLIAYETALALKPDSADARYNFALALKAGGYAQDAADQLGKLLRSNPNETRAHLSLANLHAQQLRQPALARQHYTRALELNPGHPEASRVRAWLASNP